MYALTENGQIKQFPYTMSHLRKDHPGTSFPDKPSEQMLAEYGIVTVTREKKPAYNATTHRAVMDMTPTRKGGEWVQSWTVSPKTPEEVSADLDKARAVKKKRLLDTAMREYVKTLPAYKTKAAEIDNAKTIEEIEAVTT